MIPNHLSDFVLQMKSNDQSSLVFDMYDNSNRATPTYPKMCVDAGVILLCQLDSYFPDIEYVDECGRLGIF